MKRFTPVWASALVAIMVFSGLLPLTMNVVAAIPIPHNMYGIPYDETGVIMDVDELITSWIDGVQYGDNDTFVFGPDILYDIDTDGNWVTAPGDPNSPWEKEGGDLSEPIMFVWGDMTMIDLDPEDDSILNYGVFEETEPWVTAISTPSDINLAIAQPPIFPKISMVVPEPTDTYPDYVLIYTGDPFFDMTGFYLEKNDGVLSGPSFALSGLSNATAYFYANLTTMDLDACGDELKLVWSNAGLAFGGNDIVVDRVEWNATTGGTHNVGLDHEPDNTIMTDAAAPACAVTDFAMRRDGIFPVFDTDTNDNLNDFVVDAPWPRPIIGAPVVNVIIPNGGEDWTGGSTHPIAWFMYDNNFINTLLTATLNYTIDGGTTWPAAVLDEPNPIIPGRGDAFTPVVTNWTLPFADVTDARIRVCVENPAFLASCAFSLDFEIDSTPPTVINTDPLDTAIEIPVDKVIEIYFDELMDIDATNASFQITPNPGGVIASWPTNDHASLSHNDFLQNTTYCVDVLAPLAEDDSDPGNPIAATYTFCFTTYEPKAPTITLTYPDGGQNWTGGSSKPIWFNYSHADGLQWTRIWLNYSCVGSEFNIWTADGDDPVWGMPYSWNPLPLEDANDCYIHVTIADTDGDKLSDEDTSPMFTIDSTAPLVILTDPMDDMGGIAITTNVVVTFEESSGMDRASVEAAWWMRTGITTVTGQFTWSMGDTVVTFDPDTPPDLAYFTDYTITIDTGACDKSDPGNCLAADYTFNFTTENTPPPVVQVLFPSPAGTDWISGEVLNITWNMTDEFTPKSQLDVELFLVYGATTSPIIALIGEEVYDWTVYCPQANADTTAHILVNVTDEEAQTSSATSATFVIDCTLPSADIWYSHGGRPYANEDISFDSRNETDVATYSWNFGDGGLDTVKTPTHQYGSTGTFTVSLTVHDSAGNSNTSTPRQITITTPPVTDGDGIGIEMWMLILIIIVVVVVIAIAAIAAKRRKKEPEEEVELPEEEEEEFEEEEEEVYEEEEAPVEEEEELVVEEEAAPAPVAAAAPPAEEAPATEEEPAGATKECPSCGSEVPADATECFLCGATL